MTSGIYKREIKDLTGKQFGKLTVLSLSGRDNQKIITWLCKCSCGNEKIIRGSRLTSGNAKSCGCNHVTCSHTIHSSCNTRLYRIWANMKTRCYNPKNKKYTRYGGRGIKVCEEWKKYFEQFQEWALNNGYSEKLTLDRENNDGNYEPNNCRWATQKEQQNNRSTNLVYTINKIQHSLSEWCDIYNSNYQKVQIAVRKKGENIENALINYSKEVFI